MTGITSISDALTGHLRRHPRAGAMLRISKVCSEQAEHLAAQIQESAQPESHRRLLFIEVHRLESTVRRLTKSPFAMDKTHAERVAQTAAQLRRIASATE